MITTHFFPETIFDPFPAAGGTDRPTWELAYFFPRQGQWTAADYFHLEDFLGDGFRAELVEGRLEVLPMPKQRHQFITGYLFHFLREWTRTHAPGKVSFSGLRVRIRAGDPPTYREPDIVYMKEEHHDRRHEEYWEGADLVMEVVSEDPKDIARDYESKAVDYAAAGIPEYWIVDPGQRRIRVLVLEGESYRLHGDFGPGTRATSVLLPGFAIDAAEALAGDQ